MLDKARDWYRSTFGHALVSAFLLWAALPPADLWPLAWVAPVWWVLLVRREELSGKRPYRQLWLAGFLFWSAALHWMRLPHWLTGFGWVALSFYLGFYLPVFVGLSRVAVHRLHVPVILAAPVVWTGLELARGHLLTGFTMASLGHTQYRWIELIQLSDLAGAYGVGFVVMFVAACLARTVPSRGKPWAYRPLLPAAAMLTAALVYGHLRVSRQQAEPQARIALIQGSIDIVLDPPPGTHDRMHQQYRELSQQAVARYGHLDLIVWPETAFGKFLVDYDPQVPVPAQWTGSAATTRIPMRALAQKLETPLLLGVPTFFLDAAGSKNFNSAAFVPLGDGPIGRYDKMHRVVFGEYIPFAKELSWLVKLTPLSSLNIAIEAGTEPAAFDVAGLRISPNICFESVIPHVIRRQVNTLAEGGREPDVLVNLTNDGWFWGSSELDMHLVCGVFRAVECRKPFLIAANTGFSAWIDADGRILAQGPRRATGVLLAQVAADRRRSWYLSYGDWPAGICLAACLVFAAVGTWDRYPTRRGTQKAPQTKSIGRPGLRGGGRPPKRVGRARSSNRARRH
jgi:apolipoprotein N-acyltransferase